MISCAVTFTSGAVSTGSYSIEVGIRTDDEILVGWINRDGVTLPTEVEEWVMELFPRSGTMHTAMILETLLFLGQLSQFFEHPHLLTDPPGWQYFSDTDRHYILNWLFKYADNPTPRSDFLGNGIIDYKEVAAFRTDRHKYKLFNHYQVKFVTTRHGGAYDRFLILFPRLYEKIQELARLLIQ